MFISTSLQTKLWTSLLSFGLLAILPNICEAQTIVRHKESVHSLAFSPDGSKLVSESDRGQIKIWDTRTRRVERTIQSLEGTSTLHEWASGLGFTPDNRFMLVAGTSGDVNLLNVSTGKFKGRLAHLGWESDLYFACNGSTVADHDGQLWEWSAKHGFKSLGKITPHDKGASSDELGSVAISHDGKTLITTAGYTYKGRIQFWDIRKLSLLRTISFNKAGGDYLALSPDGKVLAFTTHSNNICLLNAYSGKLIRVLKGHQGGVNCLAFSPDGKTLASGADDSKVKLWPIK